MSDPSVACRTEGAVPAQADEEETWVRRAQTGDLEAFDQIMLRYEGRIIRFLTGLVGNLEIAQELCQDSFLAAHQALPRMRGEVRLSAWLHTIALNKARSYHRRRRLRQFLPLTDDHQQPAGGDLQETVATNEAVRRALARLPQRYAQPLLLQTTGGLTCREISDALGCSEGAVKVRLLRARQAFRRLYEEESR